MVWTTWYDICHYVSQEAFIAPVMDRRAAIQLNIIVVLPQTCIWITMNMIKYEPAFLKLNTPQFHISEKTSYLMLSNMDLHCLDLGIARFMEYGVVMVIPDKLDPDHLQAAAFELLKACPILNRRPDILVSVQPILLRARADIRCHLAERSVD
jgi:hypothetical protein